LNFAYLQLLTYCFLIASFYKHITEYIHCAVIFRTKSHI